MNLIECRSCNEPDCTGCNLHRLAFALRRGLFDACKDEHNGVHIASEVVPVVRCRDCNNYLPKTDGCLMIISPSGPDFFCAFGERKDKT